MSTDKSCDRRAARRIGVEQGADFEQRRLIILQEAARAFNEKGVQNTSLDDVAARLNVTKPALYHYVSSKDEIIRLCLEMSLEANQQRLKELDRMPGTGLDKLRHLFSNWPEGVISDFGRGIVLIDRNTLSEESQEQNRKLQRMMMKGIEAIIRQGVEDGSLRKCNPAVMTLSLLGLFNSPARWYREDGALTINEITGQLIALMESGIAAAP